MVITFYIPAESFSRAVEHPCQFWIGTPDFRLSIFGRRQQAHAKPTTSVSWQGPEQAEIEKLRKEVVKLKMERDILKKAAAYFARESM